MNMLDQSTAGSALPRASTLGAPTEAEPPPVLAELAVSHLKWREVESGAVSP